MGEPAQGKILVVDDEPAVAELLVRVLTAQGHTCLCASNGETAVKLLEREDFDLILADVMMPGMSGIDLLMITRTLFPAVAVVIVTGIHDRETAFSALELGAYDWVAKPFERDKILITVAAALDRRRITLLTTEYRSALEEQTRDIVGQLAEREEEIVLRLIAAVGSRDHETEAHCRRVGVSSAVIARYLGWNTERQDLMRRAAPLHDVGKIAIPDDILFTQRSLTQDEFEVVKTHARIGAKLLEGSNVPVVRMAREIALSHHERWDGSGYPEGLHGDEIPESARIVAVADVFDSLTHDRSHRPAFTEPEALNVMLVVSRIWDPNVFDTFLRALPEIRQIYDRIDDRERGSVALQRTGAV
ncbi:MAG: response regulator [Desulfomonile tiedjei]|nr:response regulator [Desulfomonile tiedjei]